MGWSVLAHGALVALGLNLLAGTPAEPRSPAGKTEFPGYRFEVLHLRMSAPNSSFRDMGAAVRRTLRPHAGEASAKRRVSTEMRGRLPARTPVFDDPPPDLDFRQPAVPALAGDWTTIQSPPPDGRTEAKAADMGIVATNGAAATPVQNQPIDIGRPDSGTESAPRETEPADDPAVARIELPRNGRPQMSILGESVAEQYPETAGQMHGRVVSAIYLRMGLKKSWILEYWTAAETDSIPRKGRASMPDAPWPYVMMRPNLSLPPGAEALFVRGVVTAEGDLEQLMLLPAVEWAQKNSLFQALERWKIRPASKNGQALPVEVLLIIPRQPEDE